MAWTTAHNTATGLDANHPLRSNIKFAMFPAQSLGAEYKDLHSGNTYPLLGGAGTVADQHSYGEDANGRYMNFTPDLANPSNHSQIVLGSPADLALTSDMTILSGFVRTGDQYSGFGRIICRTNGGTGDDWGVAIAPVSDGSYVRWRVNGDSLEGNAALAQDQFYNIAAVYNRTAGTRNIYLDGVYEASDNLSSAMPTDQSISIGANGGSNNRGVNGKIYYVVVFDRVLTTGEIATFNADPYAIMDVGGASLALDGTAAIQEEGDTVAATGVVPIHMAADFPAGTTSKGSTIDIDMTSYIAGPSKQYVEAWYVENGRRMPLEIAANSNTKVSVVMPTFTGHIEIKQITELAEGVDFIPDLLATPPLRVAYQGWSTMHYALDGINTGSSTSPTAEHSPSLYNLVGQMYDSNGITGYSSDFEFLTQGSEYIDDTAAQAHANSTTATAYVISAYGSTSGIILDPALSATVPPVAASDTGWIERVINIATIAKNNGMTPVFYQCWGSSDQKAAWGNAKINTTELLSRYSIPVIRTAEIVEAVNAINPAYCINVDAPGGKYSVPVTSLYSGDTADNFHPSYAMAYLVALATMKVLTGVSAANNTFVIPSGGASGTQYGMSAQFIADIKTAVDQVQIETLV